LEHCQRRINLGPAENGWCPARRSGVIEAVEQPRRRDPREAKELDYARHRRGAAEYPHAWRRQLPRKKAGAQRAFRRSTAEALRAARGRVQTGRAERAAENLDDVRRRAVESWPSPTLAEHVARVLDNRVERVAWNYFKSPYDSERHRQPFARFLATVTSGRPGHPRALAQRFARILATPPAATSGPLHSWPPDPAHNHRWLLAFFADEPDWQQRLHQWISE